MYLSAVYTLADLVLDWKGIGARIADVTTKPVDVVNNDDPDPHAVADMVLARGNVLDACTTLGNRRMASSSPQSGGLCPVSAHRGTRRLRPRRADGAREAGPRGIDPTGWDLLALEGVAHRLQDLLICVHRSAHHGDARSARVGRVGQLHGCLEWGKRVLCAERLLFREDE